MLLCCWHGNATELVFGLRPSATVFQMHTGKRKETNKTLNNITTKYGWDCTHSTTLFWMAWQSFRPLKLLVSSEVELTDPCGSMLPPFAFRSFGAQPHQCPFESTFWTPRESLAESLQLPFYHKLGASSSQSRR